MLGNHACYFGSRLVFAFSCSFDEYCLICWLDFSIDRFLPDRLPAVALFKSVLTFAIFSKLQDDTYTESYISTIGVDFVS